MFGSQFKSRFRLMKPDISRKVDTSLMKQKIYYGKGKRSQMFEEGDLVWVMNIQGKGYQEGTLI